MQGGWWIGLTTNHPNPNMKPTPEQIYAALMVLKTVADIIRELKEVPSGVLYARLMEKGMTLSNYEATINRLALAGVIRVSGNVIHWVGEPAEPIAV
jgi:hypothetical protein